MTVTDETLRSLRVANTFVGGWSVHQTRVENAVHRGVWGKEVATLESPDGDCVYLSVSDRYVRSDTFRAPNNDALIRCFVYRGSKFCDHTSCTYTTPTSLAWWVQLLQRLKLARVTAT